MSGSTDNGNSANQNYFNASLRHAVDIRRYTAGEAAQILTILEKADRELVHQLRNLLNRQVREPGRAEVSVARIRTMLVEIAAARKAVYDHINDLEAGHLTDMAAIESRHEEDMIQLAVPVELTLASVSIKQIGSIVTSSPFEGRLLKDWFSTLSDLEQQRVQDAITIGLTAGETNEQIITRIIGTKAANFQDGILSISRRNAEAIVRTAANHVSNQARSQVWNANRDIISEERWVSVLDGRTTPICQARDGQVFPIGVGPRPPAHFNCLPGDCLISPVGDVSGLTKRFYEGDLIVVRTVGGHELPISPNHPVLTDRGWVPAQFLDTSYSVVRDIRVEVPSLGEVERQNVVSSFEEFAGAWLKSRESISRSVKLSSQDLHGDVINDEVCVISTNSHLLSVEDQTPLFHHNLEFKFARGDVRLPGLSSECSFTDLLVASYSSDDGAMSGDHLRSSILGRSFLPDSDISLGGLESLLGILPTDKTTIPHGSLGNISSLQETSHGNVATAETLANVSRRLSGQIELDDIIFVGKRKFSGHVYNLETSSGFYTASAGRIIVHNCRSIMVAVLDGIGIIGERPFVRSTDRRQARDVNFRDEARSEAGVEAWSSMSAAERRAAVTARRKAWAAENIGQVPAATTYQEWLTKQPTAFQDQVLGPKRGALFRKGELTLTQFVDRFGNSLTLEQLKELYPAAWARAGL